MNKNALFNSEMINTPSFENPGVHVSHYLWYSIWSINNILWKNLTHWDSCQKKLERMKINHRGKYSDLKFSKLANGKFSFSGNARNKNKNVKRYACMHVQFRNVDLLVNDDWHFVTIILSFCSQKFSMRWDSCRRGKLNFFIVVFPLMKITETNKRNQITRTQSYYFASVA
jgi:hypothetical protein